MHALVREESVVGQLVVLLREQLVELFLPSELALAESPDPVAVPERALPQESSYGEVHRMVRRDDVDRPDLDLLLEQPGDHVGVGARMKVDVTLLVGRLPELGEAVPARVQHQEIAVPDLDTLLDHLGRVRPAIVHLVAQIHDHPGPVKPVERDLVDRHPAGHEMPRRIEVGADVVRGHDVLRVHAVLGFPFYVLDLERRIIGPERDVRVQRLRQVVQLHSSSCISLSGWLLHIFI